MAKHKQKKISRNYRVTHLFDLIVKRGAKTLSTSEADFLELCVLGNAEEYIGRRRKLEKVDEEISGWIHEAAKQLRTRLTK